MALLTKVIDDRDFHSVEKAQITEAFFQTPAAQELYRYLRTVYHDPMTAGQVPSREMVQFNYPSFYPQTATDSVSILSNQLRKEKVRLEMHSLAQLITQEADLDPMQCMATLKAKQSEIASLAEVGQDLSMSSAFAQLKQRYDIVSSSQGLLGIPYPWEILNSELQGMQNSQFIVLYGRPKSMKSWVAIFMAVYAYIFGRRRVLFYTREMAPIMVAGRAACCMAKVAYKPYTQGKLQPELRDHLFSIVQDLLDDEKAAEYMGGIRQPFFKITSDRSGGANSGGGVAWLQAKIRELKPDIVFVDGMYLMKDDRTNSRSVDWKNITHISQDMKLTCQEFDIPLVGVTQANRQADKAKGVDLTELAYADALGQDADAVMRVSKKVIVDPQTKIRGTELSLTFPGVREAELEGLVIHGAPATSFGFKKIILPEEEKDETEKDGYGDKPKFRKSFMAPMIRPRPQGQP